MNENEELENALEDVDKLVDGIGQIINRIAEHNDEFVCSGCIDTAQVLFYLFKDYARAEDAQRVANEFYEKVGVGIE